MSLKIDQITIEGLRRSTPEMVKAHAEHGGKRGERGDMTAQIVPIPVGPDNHCHGIPAHPCTKSRLIGHIAGRMLFLLGRYRIDVGRIAGKRKIDAFLASDIRHPFHQIMSFFRPLVFDDGMKGVKPFCSFLLVRIMIVNENVILLIRHNPLPNRPHNGKKSERPCF